VREVAAEIGGKVDILGEQRRNTTAPTASAIARGVRHGRAPVQMDVNYFGLLRLAQEFGPAMRRPRARMAWRAPRRG